MRNNDITIRPLTDDEVNFDLKAMFRSVGWEQIDADAFDWKYKQAPESESMTAWGVFKAGELAGSTSVSKREFIRNGKDYLIYQIFDSVVRKDFQRQGIYQEQIKMILERLGETQSSFVMGFSNEKSSVALGRIPGVFHTYTNKIFIYPIRAEFISKRLFGRRLPALSSLLSAGVRAVNRLRQRRRPSDVLLEPTDSFDDFSEELSRKNSLSYEIHPNRSLDFLKWKCEAIPHFLREDVRLFRLSLFGEQIGYCVLYRDRANNRLKILDLVCKDSSQLLAECVHAIRQYAVKQRFDIVMMIVSGAPYLKALRDGGFIAAGKVRNTILPLRGCTYTYDDFDDHFWYQSPIDRDNFSY